MNITKNLLKLNEQNFAAALLQLEHVAHVPGTKTNESLEELH